MKFWWPFFVLKTSRNAMKHVVNERGRSYLTISWCYDSKVSESKFQSLDQRQSYDSLPSNTIHYNYVPPVEHVAEVTSTSRIQFQTSCHSINPLTKSNVWKSCRKVALAYTANIFNIDVVPSLTWIGNIIHCVIGIKHPNHWHVSCSMLCNSKTNS